jgi:hypothetical protein
MQNTINAQFEIKTKFWNINLITFSPKVIEQITNRY